MNGQFELGEVTPARYFSFIAVAVGLLFGFIAEGPVEGHSTLLHFLQWQLQALIPMALLVGSHVALAHFTAFERLSQWLQLAVLGLLGSLLFAPVATWLDLWLLEETPTSDFAAEVAMEFAAVAPPVVICWLAINAPWLLGLRLRRDGVAKPESIAGPGIAVPGHTPPFLDNVPLQDLSELIYLEAELHYLAVVTVRGRALVLYNLRDAVAELGSELGMQTHRAYWVAGQHVTGLRRVGRQGQLRVSNGDSVPVSRRNLAAVTAWCANRASR